MRGEREKDQRDGTMEIGEKREVEGEKVIRGKGGQ